MAPDSMNPTTMFPRTDSASHLTSVDEARSGSKRAFAAETFTAEKRPAKTFNFSAGPSLVDAGVLAKLSEELADFDGSGMGLIEHSHRDVGGPVQTCMQDTCDLLREVLNIPDNFEVLLMHGGGHSMFAAVPLNLAGEMGAPVDFIGDGFWSKRAASEASRYCTVRFTAETSAQGDRFIPETSQWSITPGAAYVHMTANETINGLEFHEDPELPPGAPPLVADFTSTLLSRPVDFTKYGIVYASTGKNLGPSGLVVAIVRKDLLDGSAELPITPGIMSFSAAAGSKPIPSLWNTPNVFGIRAMQLVLEDCKAKGGVEEMQRRARRRAGVIYQVIDSSGGFYTNPVEPAFRSLMTIPMRISADGSGAASDALEKAFIEESTAAGFYNLIGHPLFGGLRVTVYNQLPDLAVHSLADFMRDFRDRHSRA